MVLKVLILTIDTFCRCSGFAGVVVLKEQICNSFYFGKCGGLERTDV